MYFSIETIKQNCHSIENQLLLMIYEQQVETNRLLRLQTNEKDTGTLSPVDNKTPAEGQPTRRGRPKK